MIRKINCDDMYLMIFKTVLCLFLSLSVRQNTAFVEKEFLATNVKVSFTFHYDLCKAFFLIWFCFLDFYEDEGGYHKCASGVPPRVLSLASVFTLVSWTQVVDCQGHLVRRFWFWWWWKRENNEDKNGGDKDDVHLAWRRVVGCDCTSSFRQRSPFTSPSPSKSRSALPLT